MKIGIYGGTFNPPHVGHSRVMHAVIGQLKLDRLILMPTGDPPHKELPEGSPSPTLRLQMTQLVGATVEETRHRQKKAPCVVETSDLEIKRSGKSYTVDTLEALAELYPEDELVLILGEDMFMTFFQWVSPEKVAKLASICGFPRNDQAPSEELIQQGKKVEEELMGRVHLISVPFNVEVSSTELREELKKNDLNPALLPPVMPCVLGQIIRHQLYGVDISLKNMDIALLRLLVWGEVKPKRVAHIVGVEQECGRLARCWGGDETLARRAGILHDYTKYWSHQEHLDFCDEHGVELDDLERDNEKLLHAKSGAAFARIFLGEEEEVCVAIDCHTTAKGNMTTLDKILYLADYIEPQRTFEEVEEFRQIAYEDLDRAIAFGVNLSVEEMKQRDKVTHKNTLAAYEQYVVGREELP